MFDTERNQPMRVCASASGFSMRTLGIAKGTLITPMPSSSGASFLAPATKVERRVGATLRCIQATGLPCASSPASRCSTDTVWK
jgi:hypothetical protein